MIEEAQGEIRITGREVSKGEVQGTVIKSLLPLSLAEDVSLETSEILNKESELYGEPITCKVLVFPQTRQMKEYPETLTRLKERNIQPKALVAESLDRIVAQDAINSDLPAVDMIDISLLENDDEVVVNGSAGVVGLRNVVLKYVATSVVTYKGKVLLLKRSGDVGTYKGRWACVSGYVEEGEGADETAPREISEELGLESYDYNLVRKGNVVYARDKAVLWAVHPFLFEIKKKEIKLDWEHIDHRWISPKDIENYATVPKLKETLKNVLELDKSRD